MPRNGRFSELEAYELAAPVIQALLDDAGFEGEMIDSVVMGNALYGGGNPARMAALLAGLSESIPAITVDTQCCSGMDAILMAVSRVESGNDNVVIAGGLESWSRSPIRMKRALHVGEQHILYERPAFSPWAGSDPDMLEAAAGLAVFESISRNEQALFAQQSHQRALSSRESGQRSEIVPLNNVSNDAFSRDLTDRLLNRLPNVCGEGPYALNSATVAVEADASAAILLVSEKILPKILSKNKAVKVCGIMSCGVDPRQPAKAAAKAATELLGRLDIDIKTISVIELMEAFAVQAISGMKAIGLDPLKTNRSGGALARGHPVGASGAINVVRLWHELQTEPSGSTGLACIAAAGGLGTAMVGEVWC